MNQEHNNGNRPNNNNYAFSFDYSLPTDLTNNNNNDIYQNMMNDGALFDTTTTIPDNLFEFITNDNPAGQFDPTSNIINDFNLQSTSPCPPADQLPQSQQQLQQIPSQSPPLLASTATVAPTTVGQKRTRENAQIDNNNTTANTNTNTAVINTSINNVYEPPKQAVFIVVVGGRPFRLSWESLKSDGPKNFFTEYFRKHKTKRVMHIDRDPDMFSLVVHHLRGYHIQPRDELRNQALLSDANYYGLKRLREFLLQYLFLNVGGRIFRLPWSLFRKEGEPINYFTGPIWDRAMTPNGNGNQASPFYIDRDPDLFQDIISHLRGYKIHIRDEIHRNNLIEDARYYAFMQLRDKLLASRQTLDGFISGQDCPEVLIYLQDVRPKNLIRPSSSSSSTDDNNKGTPLQYKRDGKPHSLFVQVSDFSLKINQTDIDSTTSTKTKQKCDQILSVDFGEPTKKKLDTLKQGLSLKGDVDHAHVILDNSCAMTVDDRQIRHFEDMKALDNWKQEGEKDGLKLCVKRAIAQVHAMDDERIILSLVRFEAISSRYELNMKRKFLSG
ncbi:hypothetical protein BDC45DRAFT_572370 [Circinella umbellata]|nr:hypothetical protein BDC45DRAFT_572370 [Circinella umbellata]